MNLGTGTFWCNYCDNISAWLFNYYILSKTLILTNSSMLELCLVKVFEKFLHITFENVYFSFWISTLSYGDHTTRSILLDQVIYIHRDGS